VTFGPEQAALLLALAVTLHNAEEMILLAGRSKRIGPF
jgi:hypothetical protein